MKPAHFVSMRRHQHGVVLFVALMVMVALSLAGIALVRSVDTATTVAGNLAFRQSSMPTVNRAVEAAVWSLKEGPGPPTGDRNTNVVGQNYYAFKQAGDSANGIPSVLQGAPGAPPPGYPGGFVVLGADAAGNVVRYVIERMCTQQNVAINDFPKKCDMAPPKASPATTAMELDKIALGRVVFYRLTVRVDGPGNTLTFAQAMLR